MDMFLLGNKTYLIYIKKAIRTTNSSKLIWVVMVMVIEVLKVI